MCLDYVTCHCNIHKDEKVTHDAIKIATVDSLTVFLIVLTKNSKYIHNMHKICLNSSNDMKKIHACLRCTEVQYYSLSF